MAGVNIQHSNRFPSMGFSLIELLIAMTLGLLLTAGMFAVFAGNQRSSALNTETANMQESIRFALNAVTDDVRMAGYQGCMDLNGGVVDIIANGSPSADLQATIISGAVVKADASWSPMPALGSGVNAFAAPTDVTPRIGTHTIAVQFAENPGSGLSGSQQDMGSPSSVGPLVLSRAIDIETGDLALVSTCEAGEIFRVSGVSTSLDGTMTLQHGAAMNTRPTFQRVYGTDANIEQTRVMPFTTRVYFVADTATDKPDGSPVYALYQQTMPFNDPSNPPVMLVEGVENMQVLFGIGAPNGQLRYVSADNGAYDSKKIRSVRIGLLIASYDSLLESTDSNTYTLAGKTVESSSTDTSSDSYVDDKRLRLAFNTTVSVRNRRAED